MPMKLASLGHAKRAAELAPSSETDMRAKGLRTPSSRMLKLVEQAREELNREEVERAAASVKQWTSFRHRVHNTYLMRYTWIVFLVVHFLITGLVFSHFYLKKFRAMEASVPRTIPASSAVLPEEAGMAMPNYWLKRAGQPFAFGTKHAILYQLAVLPLTMSRYTIKLVGNTPLATVLPLEDMTSFHIIVGYTMCGMTLLAALIFFIYYGKGCYDHLHGAPHDPVDFCQALQGEIMITGCLLTAGAAWMAGTSYFRRYMSYEAFYACHHVAAVFYIVAILHTLDSEFRLGTAKGRVRTQDFHYVTGSICIYVVDRLWMSLSTRRAKIRKVCISNDESVMLLSLERPAGFELLEGQFAFVQVPAIDRHWHPLSIGSAPGSGSVDFYIMLVPGGWTWRVAQHLAVGGEAVIQSTVVNIYGPVGSCIQGMDGFASVSMFATGTGVAALVSIMTRRYQRLVMLSDRVFARAAEVAKASVAGSALSAVKEAPLALFQLRFRLRRARALASTPISFPPAAQFFCRCVRFDCLAHLFLVLDVCQAFWFVSWSVLDAQGFRISPAMWRSLEVMGGIATAAFLIQRSHVLANPAQYTCGILSIVDVVACAVMVSAIVATSGEAAAPPTQPWQWLRVALMLYRLVRVMSSSHALRHAKAHDSDSELQSLMMASSFHGVWSTRSASCAALVLSELQPMFDELVERFGADRVRGAMNFVVYITKTSPEQRANLQNLLRGTVFEHVVKFDRPNFKAMVMDEMKRNTAACLRTPVQARALTAICGSPEVGKILRGAVADANLVANALDMHQCHMEFKEEYYGMLPSKRGPKPTGPRSVTGRASRVGPKAHARMTFVQLVSDTCDDTELKVAPQRRSSVRHSRDSQVNPEATTDLYARSRPSCHEEECFYDGPLVAFSDEGAAVMHSEEDRLGRGDEAVGRCDEAVEKDIVVLDDALKYEP